MVGRRNLGILRMPWKDNAPKRKKCGRWKKKPLKRKTANYKPKKRSSKNPRSRTQGLRKRPYVFKSQLPHKRRRGHGHFFTKKLKCAECYFSQWTKCIIVAGFDSEGNSIKGPSFMQPDKNYCVHCPNLVMVYPKLGHSRIYMTNEVFCCLPTHLLTYPPT